MTNKQIFENLKKLESGKQIKLQQSDRPDMRLLGKN
jgi:hypothetical protein